ncbi:MAG: anthranilate synthase component I family protein [Phycisphaeraceae bacterium]|nr:anthranilate synthase component I family protein [Phycisphaeraceae bacterium]
MCPHGADVLRPPPEPVGRIEHPPRPASPPSLADLIRRWPRNRPLLCARWLSSTDTPVEALGVTPGQVITVRSGDPDPLAALRPVFTREVGRHAAVGPPGETARIASGHTAGPRRSTGDRARIPEPVGAWFGGLSYELGRMLEPAAAHRGAQATDRPTASADPVAVWIRCRELLIRHGDGPWCATGDESTAVLRAVSTTPAPARTAWRWRAEGPETCTPDRPTYLDAAHSILGLIRAGDVYQVNLTRRVTIPFSGSTRGFAAAAFDVADPRHGAVLELPDGRVVVSLSPELFLDLDPESRRVRTRPIKGTRPAAARAEDRDAGERDLRHSDKDAAELTMIVDLMRNDLARVCAPGSVRVSRERFIETHPTVHHAAAEIEGRLRPDADAADLLRATFPAGSITGAPKIRAMQVIESMEPTPRGLYCGAIGVVTDDGGVHLNVAIRTAVLSGTRTRGAPGGFRGALVYGTGGGIVADSEPAAEFLETEHKRRVLDLALGAGA